ncbi:chemotaxis protein CheB [Derxia lacustris]|uniref:chemotaxis protein CheB n=1 Tax=Derxia lacustris TaxID=764842 RepID=UPI000A17243D|nr:chemotaxis protein CheB [Derxia lacustris]
MAPHRLTHRPRVPRHALPGVPRTVVLGGSAGAIEALGALLPELPATLAVAVVVHLPADQPSLLAEVFAPRVALDVAEALDKEPLRAGALRFAPPGYHLLIGRDGCLAFDLDAPVHFSRPSIDVLFASAASALGADAIGVLLSGANDDGAAGLEAVWRAGGLTVVQAPADARMPVMPQSALARFTPAAVLPAADIGRYLAALE